MNFSGKVVVVMVIFYCINLDEILVVYDELDLLLGVVKFKFGGGYGGYNGLKDIISKFGNNLNFYCLCVGIGYLGDKNKVVGFVFGKLLVSEQKLIDDVVDEVVCCIEILLKDGLIKVINCLYVFKV